MVSEKIKEGKHSSFKITINQANILPKAKERIDQHVEQLSQVMHEASYPLEMFCIDQFQKSQNMTFRSDIIVKKNNDAIKLLKNTMNIIMFGKTKQIDAELDERMRQFLENVYLKSKNRPDMSHFKVPVHNLQAECKDMWTNIKNYFSNRKNIQKRLSNTLKLIGFNTDSTLAYDMTQTILCSNHNAVFLDDGKKTPRTWTDDQLAKIAFLREKLGFTAKDHFFYEEYFQKDFRFHLAVQFFLTLKTWIEQVPEDQRKVFHYEKKSKDSKEKVISTTRFSLVKNFDLIPKRKIALAHINISTSMLKESYKSCFSPETQAKITKETISDSELWAEWFGKDVKDGDFLKSIPQIRKKMNISKAKRFNFSMRTDGYSASLVFIDPLRKDNLPVYLQKRQRNADEKALKDDYDLFSANGFLTLDQFEMLTEDQRNLIEIIGLDPGRNDLAFTHNQDNYNEFKHLSKKQYYEKAGMNRNKRWWERYSQTQTIKTKDNKEITLAQYLTTFPSFKTMNLTTYQQMLEQKWEYNEQLWKLMTVRRRQANKFSAHSKTQKVKDEFFKDLIKETKTRGKIPIIAYGDASFPSTSKGEKPGPTKSLMRFASKHALVIRVNEYLTSQICHKCVLKGCACQDNRLDHPERQKLVFKKDPITGIKSKTLKKVELHNVVRCQAGHNYMKRDLNAAKNIGYIADQVLMTGIRPEVFCKEAKKANLKKIVVKKPKTTV
jgi:hypothetical protein